MGTGTKMFVAVLAGAAAGLTAGILFAPDSGKNTREKLNSKSKELAKTLEDISERGQKTLNELKRNIEKITANSE